MTESAARPAPAVADLPHRLKLDTGHCAVVGLQWGDEGKGKIVDLLTQRYDLVVRYNGGANAGHTVVVGKEKFALHLVPSGILYPEKVNVVGNGVVIDPAQILKEIDELSARGIAVGDNLRLSDRAHVVFPYHKKQDALLEAALSAARGDDQKIGTTGRGIGPCYADKALRTTAVRLGELLDADRFREKLAQEVRIKSGRRAARAGSAKRAYGPFGADHRVAGAGDVGDLLGADRSREKLARGVTIKNLLPAALAGSAKQAYEPFDADALADEYLGYADRLRAHVCDTSQLVHDAMRGGRSLLFEGANATLLDIDHGTYPFVTSSNCSSLGVHTGAAVPGHLVPNVVGIMKAYTTRVGGGPMPTELDNAVGDRIRKAGNEYGTTTGRPRRCGWLDAVATRYSAQISGATGIGLMLLDVLSDFDELKICTGYRHRGATLDAFPADAHVLAEVEPVYETLPGFAGPIDECRRFDDLPEAARNYVRFIETFIGVPVRVISVGPRRDQTLLR